MSSWINLGSLWKIVVFGLLIGAGAPTVFALGLRLSPDAVPAAPGAQAPAGRGLRLAAAYGCYALVLATIGWGIYFIVSGS